MNDAAIIVDEEDEQIEEIIEEEQEPKDLSLSELSLTALDEELLKAVDEEEYERAG